MRIRIVRAEPACAVRDGSDVLFTGDTATLTTSSLKHHGACDGGAGSDPTPAVRQCAKRSNYSASQRGRFDVNSLCCWTFRRPLTLLGQPCSDLHASGRRFDTVRAHQCYSISGQRCSLAVRPTPRCAESEFNGS